MIMDHPTFVRLPLSTEPREIRMKLILPKRRVHGLQFYRC